MTTSYRTSGRADEMAYVKTPYLMRMAWQDGTLSYCRACDAEVPLRADGNMLVCPVEHRIHPVNAIVNGTK